MKKCFFNLAILTVILSVFMFFLYSCGLSSSAPEESSVDTEEIVVDQDILIPKKVASFYDYKSEITYTYYRDKITDVMYLSMCREAGKCSTAGMSVMLNPENGDPLLYDDWVKCVEQKAKSTADSSHNE